jgi:hypothetical protein
MSVGIYIIIVVVIVAVALCAVAAVPAIRSRRLKKQFGSEYDRVLEKHDNRRRGEAELADRQRRVGGLPLHDLSPAEHDQFLADWAGLQERFADAPGAVTAEAGGLVQSVMRARGYPDDDPEQTLADLSVHYGGALDQYRTAQEASAQAGADQVNTEQLRVALLSYRELFNQLVGKSESANDTAAPVPSR